jgi:hypothetical protein
MPTPFMCAKTQARLTRDSEFEASPVDGQPALRMHPAVGTINLVKRMS